MGGGGCVGGGGGAHCERESHPPTHPPTHPTACVSRSGVALCSSSSPSRQLNRFLSQRLRRQTLARCSVCSRGNVIFIVRLLLATCEKGSKSLCVTTRRRRVPLCIEISGFNAEQLIWNFDSGKYQHTIIKVSRLINCLQIGVHAACGIIKLTAFCYVLEQN